MSVCLCVVRYTGDQRAVGWSEIVKRLLSKRRLSNANWRQLYLLYSSTSHNACQLDTHFTVGWVTRVRSCQLVIGLVLAASTSSSHSLWELSWFIWWMKSTLIGLVWRWPPTVKPSQSTWTVCRLLSSCITQPEIWYSFYRPTEGGRLSRPSYCGKGVHPMPEAVYRNGWHCDGELSSWYLSPADVSK